MFTLRLKVNGFTQTMSAELDTTPAAVFAEYGIETAGLMPNLSGLQLSAADLNTTFEALGVKAGDEKNLNAVTKADGAMA